MTTTATATKWIVLVYGQYGVYGRDSCAPKVLEISAESLVDVWEKLKLGDLTGGDPLDDLRLTSIQPSLESAFGERTGPDPVTDTSMDTMVRVFRAEEMSFPHLNNYLAARYARETEAQKKNAEDAELAMMQTLATRHGYQCVKAGS